MKFVDEAIIHVAAGNGGRGCLSFRREKFIEFGGPNGGNGGDGGSIYLRADAHLNTLVDYRYQHHHRAPNGRPGEGSLCTGSKGDDLFLAVPVGTTIFDADSEELLGDLSEPGQELLVARGGIRGFGNAHFKTSTNRAPRKVTLGTEGDQRRLRLELQVLADVGLLGLPNVGKSTLLRAVSNAKPKVADYPFTTLVPNIGVIMVDPLRSFVMADIPGLIEGAADGAGLGGRFLKHLSRTRLILHMVDISAGVDEAVKAYHLLENELQLCSQSLYQQPRWVLLNKCDVLLPEQVEEFAAQWREAAEFSGPMFAISGVARTGLQPLLQAIMNEVEAHAAHVLEDENFADAARHKQAQVALEVRQNTQKSRGAGRVSKQDEIEDELEEDTDETLDVVFEAGDTSDGSDVDDDEDFDDEDDDDGVEVIYTRE
jgi:GTP-binding protein